MIAVVPFRPGHVAAIRPAWPFTVEADSAELEARAAASAAAGPAWTLLLDGDPVGCGGVVLLWPGVGEAWSLSAESAAAIPLALHRAVREGLAEAQMRYRLHRIQAAVLACHVVGRRWLALLGFEEEGTMRKYGPGGHDFVRMARVGTP